MAEIVEVFEDGAENVKKFVKKNPLVVAGLVVGGVALYVLWVKSKGAAADSTAYEAIGYAGYPTVGGGGGSSDYVEDSDSYYEEIIRENQSQTDSLLESITKEYDAYLSDMETTVGRLETTVITTEQKNAELTDQLKRQNVISQMRANSELYNTITDRATKDALHAENMALAESMGWTFDASTGNYFEGNSVVYTTAKQQAGENTAYTGGKATTSTGTFVNNQTYNNSVVNSVLKATNESSKGYADNVDYSVAITEAKNSGASAETIKALETARQNKINAVYGGKEPNMTGKDYTFSSTQK